MEYMSGYFWGQYHYIRKNLYNEFNKCILTSFFYNTLFENTFVSSCINPIIFGEEIFQLKHDDNGKVENANLFY